MIRGVARRVQHSQREIVDADAIAVLEPAVRRKRGILSSVTGRRPAKQRCSGLRGQQLRTRRVIAVSVRDEHAVDRTARLRDDTFDVLGSDLHILARIEHDGASEQFAFATENREARVSVGTARDSTRGVGSFFALGIEHILTGYDHLLFLLALMVGGGSAWALVKIVTAFTLAHSVTLAAAALDLIALPSQIVESAIALSIAYVALENLLVVERGNSRRWLIALVFGLVHGFGFSAVLKELGLPPNGLAWSLLLFNLGVEAGQAGVIVAAVPFLIGLRRASWRRQAVRAMSLAVLAVAVVLLVERAFFA